MKWFRRHIKTGSRLALFALAIQFALSFGHFHFDPARAGALTYIGLASVEGSAPAETSRPQPAQHDSDHQPAAPCAICAMLMLAGNLVLSPPPALFLPEAAELRYLATDTELARHSSARLPFQPRAPPAS